MRQSVTRRLHYKPGQLFDLVGDVERYPEFVPWVTDLRTWNRRPAGEGRESLDAEATVKFAIVKERFATRVTLDPAASIIDVELLSGPFSHLTNRWRFTAEGAETLVDFSIDFAFRSRLLERLLAANTGYAVSRLMACFEGRARRLYGGGAV